MKTDKARLSNKILFKNSGKGKIYKRTGEGGRMTEYMVKIDPI
jgi:hypothetical protein